MLGKSLPQRTRYHPSFPVTDATHGPEKLENLVWLSIQNVLPREEINSCNESLDHLHLTLQTNEYPKRVLKGHQGESTRLFTPVMKKTGPIQIYIYIQK